MTKRGRPRLNRPRVDLGTPEQIRKRAEALGPKRIGWPEPDLNNAESALGRLLWNGYLHSNYDQGKRMYEAGVSFCAWWMLVYPKTFSIGTLSRFQPGGGTEVDKDEAEQNLKAATVFLGKERAVLDAVINACVYQRLGNHGALEKLRTGLMRLMEMKREARRAA